MEHDTPEAKEKYLKEHPGADKSKHTVKGDKGGPKGKAQKQEIPAELVSEVSSSAQKAKARRDDTTKAHEELKSLKKGVDDANPTAEKKFNRAYDKLFKGGEESAKAGKKLLEKAKKYEEHFPEGSEAESAYELLDQAIREWDNNRMDHIKTKGELSHKMTHQAEQTWAYATKVDDQIDMLAKALKGEFD